MKKKTIVVWAVVAAVAVLAVVGVSWWLLGRPAAPTGLLFVHGSQDASVVKALNDELQVFRGLYPDVPVRMSPTADASGSGDLVLLDRYPATPAQWVFPLTPWTGNLWVLAAHKARLDGLAKTAPAQVSALRKGTLDAAGFVTLLGKAKALGPAPITVGNSHLWPFLLWLQAWTAATLGPDAAAGLPLPSPMEELKRWRSLGWVDAQAWPQGWAQGLQPLQDGQAMFALVSAPQLSALAPATRAALEFLPFPKRPLDRPWNLGNAQFLAVSAASPKRDQAALLAHFLSSPGVTARLAQATGRPFFAWNAEDGRSPVVLPDWSALVNDPAGRALAEELAK